MTREEFEKNQITLIWKNQPVVKVEQVSEPTLTSGSICLTSELQYCGRGIILRNGRDTFQDVICEGYLGESKETTVVEETVTQAEPFRFDTTGTREKIIKFENKVKGMGYKYNDEASVTKDQNSIKPIDAFIYTKKDVTYPFTSDYCLVRDIGTNILTATHSWDTKTVSIDLENFISNGLRPDGSVIGQEPVIFA
jgi:hypothetical protein